MTKVSSQSKPDHRLLVAVLIAVPLLIVLAKWPGLPTAEFLRTHFTLETLPLRVQHKLTHILFVPLGAMLIVLVRLTLGLRLLGPFRSLLLAVAFQATGIPLGLTFLTVTIAIVTLARPSIRALRMPYFGRTTVLLSSVAGLMVLVVLAGSWMHIGLLNSIAYFPIVVLSLIADAFARTAKSEGWRSALWRAGITASVAILLTALAKIPVLTELLSRYPELMAAHIGGIIFVSRSMNWRVLAHWNPPVLVEVGDNEDDEEEPSPPAGKRQDVVPTVAKTAPLPLGPLPLGADTVLQQSL